MSFIKRFLVGLLAVRLGHNVNTAATDDNMHIVVGRDLHDIPKNLFGVFFEEARAIVMLWLIGGKPEPEDLFSCRSTMQGKVGCMQVSSYLGPTVFVHKRCLSPCIVCPITRSYGLYLSAELINDRSFDGLAFENGFLDPEVTQTELPFPLPPR